LKCIYLADDKGLGAVISISTIARNSKNYMRLITKDKHGNVSITECDPSNNQGHKTEPLTIGNIFMG